MGLEGIEKEGEESKKYVGDSDVWFTEEYDEECGLQNE